MDTDLRRTAIVVGASSGIGEALACELNRAGWRLGLLARRVDRLEALRDRFGPETVVRYLDVARHDAAAVMERALEDLGGADLVIISAGTGHNAALEWAPDLETGRSRRATESAPDHRDRGAAGLCRHSHDEAGSSLIRRRRPAARRLSCEGREADPSSCSKAKEARLHHQTLRTGRLHLQAPATTWLTSFQVRAAFFQKVW